MPQGKAEEIKNSRQEAWAYILRNLGLQFPPGNALPEYNWILKEIGAYCDADILSMASNRMFFTRTVTSILNTYAEANPA
eukprot:16437764-Heterocapsa_arctica.AAC.1